MKPAGSAEIVAGDVRERIQELGPGGWSETNAHGLVLLEQSAALSENGVQRKALSRLDLPITAGKRLEDLPLFLGLLIGINAQHHRASPTALSDDHRFAGIADPLEDGCGVLPEIRDRDDFRNLCHRWALQTYG